MIQLKREPDHRTEETLRRLAFPPTFFFIMKMLQNLSPGAQSLAGFHRPSAIYEALQLAGSICTDTEPQGF